MAAGAVFGRNGLGLPLASLLERLLQSTAAPKRPLVTKRTRVHLRSDGRAEFARVQQTQRVAVPPVRASGKDSDPLGATRSELGHVEL